MELTYALETALTNECEITEILKRTNLPFKIKEFEYDYVDDGFYLMTLVATREVTDFEVATLNFFLIPFTLMED